MARLLIFFFCIPGLWTACQDGISKTSETTEVTADTVKSHLDTTPSWPITYIMGQFDPALDSNFVEVQIEHADREGLLLRRETYSAFVAMYNAALQENVKLVIRSATRNFDYQKGIWEAKWKGEREVESGKKASDIKDPTERALEILKYSSMPGTSRHHWGTDIDLNAFTNEYFEQGKGLKIYQWLSQHAAAYGFCQPYSEKGAHRPEGYQEEKWHWSYLPLSLQMTRSAEAILRNDMIQGFDGAEEALNIDVKTKYVLGIDSSCVRSISSN